MSQDSLKAIRGLYDAFNRGDLDTLEQGFNRGLLWNEPENSLYSAGNPYRGFEAVRNGVFAPIAREFDGYKCDLERLIDGGEYVVGTGRYRGKCKATGKTFATQFCHVMHLDGTGRIDSMQGYSDTLDQANVTGKVQFAEPMRIPQPAM